MTTGHTPLSDAAEHRNNIALEMMHRLQHFAWKAVHIHNNRNDEVVVICIHVDSRWRWLADELMPGNEAGWQAQRSAGKQPIALGLVLFDIVVGLAGVFPDIRDVLLETPESGVYKGIVLDDGGCTVIDVAPKEDTGVPH